MARTLLLTYKTEREYRVTIGDDLGGMARAIENAAHNSGLMGNQTGIDPESIRFTIEED